MITLLVLNVVVFVSKLCVMPRVVLAQSLLEVAVLDWRVFLEVAEGVPLVVGTGVVVLEVTSR